MTSAKPLLKAAFSSRKRGTEPLPETWYGKYRCKHVDEQIEEFAERGDAEGLRNALEAGLIDPQRATRISPQRYAAIARFAHVRGAIGHRELIVAWLKALTAIDETLAQQCFDLIPQYFSRHGCPSDLSRQLLLQGLFAGIEAGLRLDVPGGSTLSRNSAAGKGRYRSCSALSVAAALLDDSEFKRLVDGVVAQSAGTRLAGAQIHQAADTRHGATLGFLDFCIETGVSFEKMTDALRLLDVNKPTVSTSLAITIRDQCDRIDELASHDLLNIATVLSGGADFTLVTESWEPKKSLLGMDLVHRLCEAQGRAVPEAKDRERERELHEGVRLLMGLTRSNGKRVFDPNSRDVAGNTYLHLASQSGSAALCLTVLRAGADQNAPNLHGVSPTDVARNGRRDDVLTVYRAHDIMHRLQPASSRSLSIR